MSKKKPSYADLEKQLKQIVEQQEAMKQSKMEIFKTALDKSGLGDKLVALSDGDVRKLAVAVAAEYDMLVSSVTTTTPEKAPSSDAAVSSDSGRTAAAPVSSTGAGNDSVYLHTPTDGNGSRASLT